MAETQAAAPRRTAGLPRTGRGCADVAGCTGARQPGRRGSDRPRPGFTLVEMMVVVAILAVLATAAVMTFSGTVSGYRISNQANGLAHDLQFARGEAIKRGLQVGVCASSDGATCSNSASWQFGWIVFVDANNNSSFDAGETVLRAETQNPGSNTLLADPANAGLNQVYFNRQGSTVAQPAVTFQLHDPNHTAALVRCVVLVPSGRATTVNSGIGNCS